MPSPREPSPSLSSLLSPPSLSFPIIPYASTALPFDLSFIRRQTTSHITDPNFTFTCCLHVTFPKLLSAQTTRPFSGKIQPPAASSILRLAFSLLQPTHPLVPFFPSQTEIPLSSRQRKPQGNKLTSLLPSPSHSHSLSPPTPLLTAKLTLSLIPFLHSKSLFSQPVLSLLLLLTAKLLSSLPS